MTADLPAGKTIAKDTSRPVVTDAIGLLAAPVAVAIAAEDGATVLWACSRSFSEQTRLDPDARLDPRAIARIGCANPLEVMRRLDTAMAGLDLPEDDMPLALRAQRMRIRAVRLPDDRGASLIELLPANGIPQTAIASLEPGQRAALQARCGTEAALLTDAEGYTVWVNHAFELSTGYCAEDIVGRKPGTLLQGPLTDPSTVAEVAEKLAARQPVRFEILNYRKDGRRRWRAMQIDPVYNDDGRHIGFIAMQRDIDGEKNAARARAQSDQRLEHAFSGTDAALWDIDLTTGQAWFTANTGRMLGTEPPDAGRETVLDWWLSRVHPGDRPDMASRLRAHLHHGARLDTSARIADRIEGWRWIRFRGEAEADGSGRPSRSLGLHLDISQNRFAPDRGDIMERQKAELVSSVTHELRDTLNGVLGSARLLSLMKLEGRQQALADRIVTGCQSIQGLVDDTLDLARIEAGLLRLNPAPFSPATLCMDVAAAFEDAAEAKGLTLQTDIAIPPATVLVGDARRLRQIAGIFLSNAIRFTDSGGLVLRAESLPSGDLRLSVTDTGPGIPAEMQAMIFQRYGQAHVAGSAVGGTGLGLSIAGDLAHMLKARIGVDSRLGQGATFWVALPFPEEGAVPARFRPRPGEG